jgi:hypothetical protein
MAAKGLQRLVRRDVLAKLKANAGVTALVAATSIHSQDPGPEPAWPFLKFGAPQTLPLRASCVDGGTVNFGLHGFSRGRRNGSDALVETAEDHAGRIGAAIEAAVDGARSTLTGVGTVRYRLADMLLLVDGAEPGAFHYSCTVRARVLA